MLKRLFILFFAWSVSQQLSAQDALSIVQSGKDLNVLYRNEATGGIVVHSTGFGANFRRTKHVTEFKKRVLEFEFVNIRHIKEVKTINPYFDNSKGFYYGKMLNFQTLRTGIGFQNTLYRKAERKSVEIRYISMLGASIGFAKPVYLEILHGTNSPAEYVLTTEKYDPDQHPLEYIYGRAPYFKGLNETQFYPGGYAKFGLSFEYADARDDVKAIETGIVLDAYYKTVPIMAYAKNNQLFLTAYIHFIWGKRWF